MKYITLLLFIHLVPLSVLSQENLSDLGAPSSPAIYMLGLEHSSVLKPKTYQAFNASLFSNFINSGNPTVPNDFALEFSPYWAKDHGLSIEDYIDPKDIFHDQLWRNFSISLASTQNFIIQDSINTNAISLGFRTTLFQRDKNARNQLITLKEQLNDNQEFQANVGAASRRLIRRDSVQTKEAFLAKIEAPLLVHVYNYLSASGTEMVEAQVAELLIISERELGAIDTTSAETYSRTTDALLQQFQQIVNDHTLESRTKVNRAKIFSSFEENLKEKLGLSIDFAYSTLVNFPNNNFETTEVPRHSFWITPGYKLKAKNSFIDFRGVLRYEWYNTDYYETYFPNLEIFENNLDAGVYLARKTENINIDFETTLRFSSTLEPTGIFDIDGTELLKPENNSDFQAVGSFTYKFNDQVAITYTLGNQFDFVAIANETVVSLLSVNFGFGQPKIEDLK